jgi:hypothetical protein
MGRRVMVKRDGWILGVFSVAILASVSSAMGGDRHTGGLRLSDWCYCPYPNGGFGLPFSLWATCIDPSGLLSGAFDIRVDGILDPVVPDIDFGVVGATGAYSASLGGPPVPLGNGAWRFENIEFASINPGYMPSTLGAFWINDEIKDKSVDGNIRFTVDGTAAVVYGIDENGVIWPGPTQVLTGEDIQGYSVDRPSNPPGEILANSLAEFSGIQGQDNWWYGYYDQRADAEDGDGFYSVDEFVPFLNDRSGVVSTDPEIGAWKNWPNHWNGDYWDVLANDAPVSHGPWTQLMPIGGHPAANAQLDPEVHWSIRRWSSETNGTVYVDGMFYNTNGAGDGTVGRILVDGVEVWSAVSNGTEVPIAVEFDVSPISVVDFVIDADGAGVYDPSAPITVNFISDGNDFTEFFFDIHDLTLDCAGPQVVGVKVGSSAWAPGFRASVDSDDSLGYPIPAGAGQLVSLPWVDQDTIHVKFSEDVGSVTAADIELRGVNVSDYAIASVTYDAADLTATILLDSANSPLGADKLRLVVKDTVTDLAGNALDGEWTDGVSTISGNGTAGGDFSYRINVLPADVSQEGSVFANDAAIALSKQLTKPGNANYSIFADADGSGSIFANDAAQVLARQLTYLPAGEPTSLSMSVTQVPPTNAVVDLGEKLIPLASAAGSVPEPSSMTLALLSIVFFSSWLRRSP